MTTPLPIRRPLPGRIRLADLTLAEEFRESSDSLCRALAPLCGSFRPRRQSSRYAVPLSGRALMRRADVPTQRRPRHRQVSQGMREGNGRTAADAASVGVGAIEVLHPSPGPSIANPKPNRQNKMQTQTPQPNTPIAARLIRHSRGVGNPSLLNNHPQTRSSPHPRPSPQYQTRGRGRRCSSFPLSLPPQYQTRGKRLRHGAGACLCFFLPLSLKGPKSLPRVPRGGEGDQGGEGSSVGRGVSPPRFGMRGEGSLPVS